MVQPEIATVTFRNDSTNQDITLSVYLSDVAGAFGTISKTGVAGTGSQTFTNTTGFWRLTDISIPTGLTATTQLILYLDDANIPEKVIPLAQCINTLPSRSFPNIAVKPGRKLQFMQG